MTGAGDDTAKAISEMLLETTAKALLSNDFDSFALCFHLPHTIETPDTKTVLKTRSALKGLFDKMVTDYTARRITDLIRFCEVAAFTGPDQIEATHISHVMVGSQRVTDPFPSYSVLRHINGRWQCCTSQYAVDGTTPLGRALNAGIKEQKPEPHACQGVATENRKN